LVGVNILFLYKGFVKMGIDDSSLATGGPTDPFITGQEKDADNLGDPKSHDGKTPDWDSHFLQDIHGLILISGDCHGSTDKKKADIDKIFGSSIKHIVTIRGDVRPGAEDAHEHFGFLDGISNPAVIGFDKNIQPGPSPVQAGVIVTGKDGDPGKDIRKDWSKDGSFAVFRYLFQKVPEFNEFLRKNPLPADGDGKPLTPAQGSDLLGARMVGRWKSGAPIDITPFRDDPILAKDPTRNNNFSFKGEIKSQLKCPFAAHIRKTNPRDDLEVPPSPINPISVQSRRIARRGIQFGPELTHAEKALGKTIHGRGLLFNCYQTSIINGFQFHQQSWANNASFPPFTGLTGKGVPPNGPLPGLDPLIGQGKRTMIGLDPNHPLKPIDFGVFIVPKGGEYFFSPSISGLKDTIAKA
jgi:Dyp-type peroxidase family